MRPTKEPPNACVSHGNPETPGASRHSDSMPGADRLRDQRLGALRALLKQPELENFLEKDVYSKGYDDALCTPTKQALENGQARLRARLVELCDVLLVRLGGAAAVVEAQRDGAGQDIAVDSAEREWRAYRKAFQIEWLRKERELALAQQPGCLQGPVWLYKRGFEKGLKDALRARRALG